MCITFPNVHDGVHVEYFLLGHDNVWKLMFYIYSVFKCYNAYNIAILHHMFGFLYGLNMKNTVFSPFFVGFWHTEYFSCISFLLRFYQGNDIIKVYIIIKVFLAEYVY